MLGSQVDVVATARWMTRYPNLAKESTESFRHTIGGVRADNTACHVDMVDRRWLHRLMNFARRSHSSQSHPNVSNDVRNAPGKGCELLWRQRQFDVMEMDGGDGSELDLTFFS